MRVVQIVRRFGPVGGMEKYVYELCLALDRLSCEVVVICESVECDLPNFRVLQVQQSLLKPRWVGMLGFRRKVRKLLRDENLNSTNGWVVHSHERSVDHDVTTFHGPPMQGIQERKPFWFLSPRLWAWLRMEATELMGPNVKAVVPNSITIAEQLLDLYPAISGKVTEPGWPGVSSESQVNEVPSNNILFVGKEWQRKGLPKAFEIVKALRERYPQASYQLIVVGADKQQQFNSPWVTWVIWTPDWLSLGGTLIHPASVEPYGMVVAEAWAAGLSVVVSSESGVAGHLSEIPQLSSSQSVDDWVQAIRVALGPPPIQRQLWFWDDLAESMQVLYQGIRKQ